MDTDPVVAVGVRVRVRVCSVVDVAFSVSPCLQCCLCLFQSASDGLYTSSRGGGQLCQFGPSHCTELSISVVVFLKKRSVVILEFRRR